ncbi:Exodeoxyribonuclease V alpha chain [Serratia rubidaea]|uniref:Exodeoxyribonuclease V alpha chain n=1 Tax=Serratia rubidaea TaxID=61652 RepID=A0A4V6JI60_SERRU|nr:Exodeoxyribonuclease V alpha chain [Serratia rubidaea]
MLQGQPAQAAAAVRDSLCLLRKSYRFDANSGIGQLAFAVNAGDVRGARVALDGRFDDVAGYPLAETVDYQALLDACVAGYRDYLTQVAAGVDAQQVLDAFGRFQVLCALREGPFGVSGLNERIETGLQRAGLIRRASGAAGRWYRGRPVMIGPQRQRAGVV